MLVWSREAIDDLVSMRAAIVEDSPKAAQRMALRIVSAAESILPENPQAGRAGRVPGTRELVIAGTPYIVPYRLRDGETQILRVFHGARRWPRAF
jgi:toxin ParE1/3/4